MYVSSSTTVSPSPSGPRTFAGIGSSTRPLFSVHTLVRHSVPFSDAITGVLPHAIFAEGACFFGTVAKVHPPLPGYLKSLVRKTTLLIEIFFEPSIILAKSQRRKKIFIIPFFASSGLCESNMLFDLSKAFFTDNFVTLCEMLLNRTEDGIVHRGTHTRKFIVVPGGIDPVRQKDDDHLLLRFHHDRGPGETGMEECQRRRVLSRE